jgi:plastocyanin
MRRLMFLVAAMSAFAIATSAVFAADDRGVRTIGDERVVPNAMVQATLRFTPGMIKVASGEQLTWTHDDNTPEPHTVTVVEAFPEPTLDAIFACGAPGGPCEIALTAHFAGGVFHPVVEAGAPGLDAPGDSLFLADDTSVTATVSAPSGTTLLYLCAIHPWMQGTIAVQ